jgi:four helix bundle protein
LEVSAVANVIEEKSYAFAVRCVKMASHLRKQRCEPSLVDQVLRSGTSIGANVEEALGAQSKADFITKLTIAYKETRETAYWLRLLHDTGHLTDKSFESISADILEITRLLTAIQRTAKASPKS